MQEIQDLVLRNPEITLEIKKSPWKLAVWVKPLRNQETCLKSRNLFLKSSDFEILSSVFLLFVWVFVHYHRIVTKTSVRASAWIGVAVAFWNGLILWGSICLCLYPLCRSRLVNFCFIFLNSHSSELVLKHRLVSPLLIALIVVGG